MNIYFDFDLYGEIAMDSHLLDIMLAYKRQIPIVLSEFGEEMDKDAGYILVTMKPGLFTISYHYNKSVELAKKLIPVINSYDWPSIIGGIAAADNN